MTWGETGEPAWGVLAEQVELHDHDLLDAGEYRGHDGYRRWLENWSSTFPESSVDPVEFIDAGERVVVILRLTATGAGSGVTIEREDAMVYEMRDGKAVRIDYYNNRAEALESVDLEQ